MGGGGSLFKKRGWGGAVSRLPSLSHTTPLTTPLKESVWMRAASSLTRLRGPKFTVLQSLYRNGFGGRSKKSLVDYEAVLVMDDGEEASVVLLRSAGELNRTPPHPNPKPNPNPNPITLRHHR